MDVDCLTVESASENCTLGVLVRVVPAKELFAEGVSFVGFPFISALLSENLAFAPDLLVTIDLKVVRNVLGTARIDWFRDGSTSRLIPLVFLA
jgi:hypothetical protein